MQTLFPVLPIPYLYDTEPLSTSDQLDSQPRGQAEKKGNARITPEEAVRTDEGPRIREMDVIRMGAKVNYCYVDVDVDGLLSPSEALDP